MEKKIAPTHHIEHMKEKPLLSAIDVSVEMGKTRNRPTIIDMYKVRPWAEQRYPAQEEIHK
tara:strand:+ start:1361 stop:1543 length:183 start_codon:yes stop_codon:yes gene_type:complete